MSESESELLDNFVGSNSTQSTSNAFVQNEANLRSDVWKHFRKISLFKVECKHCLSVYEYSGNTTNLMRHVRRKHKDKLPNNGDSDKSQPTVTSFTCSVARQKQITEDIAEWIALEHH